METSEVNEQRARVLTAKLSLPHMGFVLSRPRLHALVGPVRAGGAICLVAGPGYGKTAFIVDLLSTVGGRTVYFSLDEGDRDPNRFLSYLAVALGMEPDNAASLPGLDWSASGERDGAVLDLAARLVDFIREKAGEQTLLAIDDFHLVEASPPIVTILGLILRGLPPGWTVLVSSRHQLPLELDRVAMGGRLVRVCSRQLRLTPKEVAAWAAKNWAVTLQPVEARALWRLTQGWPAALVLLGQRLLSSEPAVAGKDIVELIAQGRDLRVYLEQDILGGLEPSAARTMLMAGLLPRVIFPRDEVLFAGQPGCTEMILDDFVSRGFLVTRVGQRSYTVHPLVRGLAERQARATADGLGLLGRVAAHLENLGEHYHAAYLYLRAGRFADACRPLRSLALSSLDATLGFTRDEWAELMPDRSSGADICQPWLLVAKARALQQQSDYAAAASLYGEAARLLAASGDKEGLLPVLLRLAFCVFIQGLWEESLAVLGRCGSVARGAAEKAEVLVAEGSVLVSLCRWDEAVEKWERALILAPAPRRTALSRRVFIGRARLFLSLGHYRLARSWIDKAMALGAGPVTPARAMALDGAGVLAYLTGEYDLAERLAVQCRRLVHTHQYEFMRVPGLLCQAAVVLGRWDYRGAVAKLREAQSLAAEVGDVEQAFRAEEMFGDLCRCNRNPARALDHHRNALDLASRSRLAVFERVRAVAAVGMDLVLLGRDEEALATLEESVRLCRQLGLKSPLAPALFYLGWLHACGEREREAASCLGEAMRIAEEHEHIHFFSQEAKVTVPILALCDRFGTGSFVRSRIVPLLPRSLQDYFSSLTDGNTYPTDVSLGPPRRQGLKAREAGHVGG